MVVVVGSINLDTTIRVVELPAPGETVSSLGRSSGLGGKGANQAVAAAKAGGTVAMIGAVGQDAAGRVLRDRLEEARVDTTNVSAVEGCVSGGALILVDEQGENSIVIEAGANSYITPELIAAHAPVIEAATVVVIQCEIPEAAIAAALDVARSANVRAVLNLAPYMPVRNLRSADPLVLNEIEATQLVGRRLDTLDDVAAAAGKLLKRSRSVVITVGAAGAIVGDSEGVTHVAGTSVETVVDTTGAGDAFVGVLTQGLARGLELRPAALRAVRAAGLSVGLPGASQSYAAFGNLD